MQTNGWLHQSFGFHQGFDRYVFPIGGGPRAPSDQKPSMWAHADRVVDEAERLIEGRDSARPMFLYLHFMDVHEYASPPEFQTFGTDAAARYQASTLWVDSAIARVREALDDAGSLNRTVMLVTADHGEAFGEHGVHGHARNVLTPVLWVPLVVRLPFELEPTRVAMQVRGIDLAPTILDLVGVAVPETFEGESMLPLLDADEAAEPRTSYAQLGVPLYRDSSVQRSVNTGDWTYARNVAAVEDEPKAYESRAVAPGAEFLFDRSIDPGENVNLIGREPQHAARMRLVLDEHHAGAAGGGVVERGVRIDPGIAERLRAMGYLR